MDLWLLGRIPRRPPRVVVLPTAAAPEDPHRAAENGVRYFRRLGAVTAAAMVVTRGDAESRRRLAPLQKADLVYLTGGDPWHLLECLQGTALGGALEGFWRRGGMVVGSSAGAMVLGEKMRSREGEVWIEGLGLAARVAVLPHHERLAHFRIRLLRRSLDPGVALLGIASATACVNSGGNTWQVVGAGTVTVYLGEEAHRYRPSQHFTLR